MINRNNFLLTEIPKFYPGSYRYLEFWREQLKRCMEGYWHSGTWMPAQLYFYANFGTILGNKFSGSKSKMPMKPFLRDLEWEFFYGWVEARGFSGFELDDEFTCHRDLIPEVWDKLHPIDQKNLRIAAPEAFKPDGSLKTYIPAKDYLRKIQVKPLGRAMFKNQSKDFMMMGSRGFGKSYSVGVGIVLHEWLFDGKNEYIHPSKRNSDEITAETATTICVGAGDSKYSGELLSKTKFALSHLPGKQKIKGVIHPSPLSKSYKGSWKCGDPDGIEASYKKKIGGRWEEMGTKTSIKHRSFADNDYAANGLRCSVMVYEEIGMFSNLIGARNASLECCMNGSNKYGSMMFLGTGGDMDKGTVDASIMFNNPSGFNIVAYPDTWEGKPEIGYFVPAYKGLNDYKDENGFTLEEPAKQYLENHRKKLRESAVGSSAIDDELQNRPLIPSEAFLTKKGNIFPVDELRNRKAILESNNNFEVLEKKVKLFFDKDGINGVGYQLDLQSELVSLNHFPLPEKQKSNREGCVVIYEFPKLVDGRVPKDMYIIGHDPYASDDPDGNSLGAVYVLKTSKYSQYGMNEIVAEYVGRPYQGRHILNENIHKLSLFYGEAKIYFENVRGNVKEYFEKHSALRLLAAQPTTLFTKKSGASHKSSTIIYGYPMSSKGMKMEGIQYIRDWLLEERGHNEEGQMIRNLDLIPSRALLQELISFNLDGNFDRVMAFMGCVIGIEERYNKYKQPEEKEDNSLSFLTENKLILGEQKLFGDYQMTFTKNNNILFNLE